jgi:3-hydroxypropanoate dehydrogenase
VSADDLPWRRGPANEDGLDEAAWLDRLFLKARTHTQWQPRPVPQGLLRRVYELARMGPTAANAAPARFVFVVSDAGKAKLLPHLSKGNQPKAAQAPVTVIVGYDRQFARHLPKLFPHVPSAASWFADPVVAQDSAIKNSALQAAYLILAARSLGLDAGPMTGFFRSGVDAAFFPDSQVTTSLLCNLGYGVTEALQERLPRLAFDEACRFA